MWMMPLALRDTGGAVQLLFRVGLFGREAQTESWQERRELVQKLCDANANVRKVNKLWSVHTCTGETLYC